MTGTNHSLSQTWEGSWDRWTSGVYQYNAAAYICQGVPACGLCIGKDSGHGQSCIHKVVWKEIWAKFTFWFSLANTIFSCQVELFSEEVGNLCKTSECLKWFYIFLVGGVEFLSSFWRNTHLKLFLKVHGCISDTGNIWDLGFCCLQS